MSTKTIRLKIGASKVSEVLSKLGWNGDLEFDLDLEESKKLYTELSTSSDIIDWQIVGEKIEEVVEESEEKLHSISDLAIWLEAVFRLSKKSPALVFSSQTFNEEVEKLYLEVGSEPVSINQTMIRMILGAYYNTSKLEDAIEHTKDMIKTEWKNLGSYNTIVEVVYHFYHSA